MNCFSTRLSDYSSIHFQVSVRSSNYLALNVGFLCVYSKTLQRLLNVFAFMSSLSCIHQINRSSMIRPLCTFIRLFSVHIGILCVDYHAFKRLSDLCVHVQSFVHSSALSSVHDHTILRSLDYMGFHIQTFVRS